MIIQLIAALVSHGIRWRKLKMVLAAIRLASYKSARAVADVSVLAYGRLREEMGAATVLIAGTVQR